MFSPSSIHIVEQTDSRVHFYWLQENIENVFTIELHYVMEDGLSGVYSYAKYTNDKSYDVVLGETRMVNWFFDSFVNWNVLNVFYKNRCTVSQPPF